MSSHRVPHAKRTLGIKQVGQELEHQLQGIQRRGQRSALPLARPVQLKARRKNADLSSFRPRLDLSDLDWHLISIDEALRRLAVAPKTGLESAQTQRRAAQFGANKISPPPSRMLRKIIGWVFGGFGSLLLVASVVCFIAWYVHSLFSPV